MNNKIFLNNNWSLNCTNFKNLKVKFPSSILSNLLDKKLIDDPFYADNEIKIRKLLDDDFLFTSKFKLTKKELTQKNYLCIDRVDTICEIYINDILIETLMDMHLNNIILLNNKILKEENTIKLLIKSPYKYIKNYKIRDELYVGMGICEKNFPVIRKAHYMFGWDWGPNLADSGVYSKPFILSTTLGYFKDYRVEYEFLKNNKVKVNIDFNYEVLSKAQLITTIKYKNKILDSKKQILNKKNKISFLIDNPKLWYPNGYGKQELYDLIFEVKTNNYSEKINKRIGIKDLKIDTSNDKLGRKFEFYINGIKIFIKGANIIPENNIIPYVNKTTSKTLLKKCVEAKQNLIRVWGGGYYPFDEFYDICDELGILIWQDLMFACATYDIEDSLFYNQVIKEIPQQIKRIRNHPSILLIAGNNENEYMIKDQPKKYLDSYRKMYIDVIKPLVKKETSLFYINSSPTNGEDKLFDDPNSDKYLDMHCWEVWHSMKPIEYYNEVTPRLLSEFGFCSFPIYNNIQKFVAKKDLSLDSKILKLHHKDPNKNYKKMKFYVSSMYKKANNFKDFVNKSMFAQAEGIKMAVEHIRQNQAICSGTIYWQFNDCYPSISWSSVDYYLGLKPLFYYSQRFFDAYLISGYLKNNYFNVNVSNTSTKNLNCTVKYYLMDLKCNILNTIIKKINIDISSSEDVIKIKNPLINSSNKFIYLELYDEENKLISSNTFIDKKDRKINYLKPTFKIEKINNKTFKISSNVYSKNVILEAKDNSIIFSNNYFNLIKDKPVIFKVNKEINAKDLIAYTIN